MNNNDLVTKYNAQLQSLNDASNRYIDELLAQAQGDKDEAIKILTRDHEQALGTDDGARAQFLESVADQLEKRVGRIPYDYKVGTTRTNEDLARTTEVTNRNKDQALARLAEDEKVWKVEFNKNAQEGRATQQEQLLQRGILSGTRDNAQGLAGQEVRNFEKDMGSTLSAYERELARNKQDINQAAGDTLFEANRSATRSLEDLKTDARRAAQEQTDTFSDGKTAAERAFAKQKALLEKQKQLSQLANESRSAYLNQQYG